MSVEQIEASIRALPPAERAQLVEWFDDHRYELAGEADDFELSVEQKAEILRRVAEADAHPELLEPWAGTTERVRKRLHEIRAQKAAASRG
jgi:putative addiction module component (TIGR02574 family)